MLYEKRRDNLLSFKEQIFKLFTDACSGDLDEFTQIVYNMFTIEDFAYADDVRYWNNYYYFQNVVIPHKIAVYQSGVQLMRNNLHNIDKDLFMRNLWLHDISKFSANESFAYCEHDFKSDKPDLNFDAAWLHHINHNPHHPEHWFLVDRAGFTDVLRMPDIYVYEMVADWMGAGITYGSSLQEWLPKNIHKFRFHELTAITLQQLLSSLGINTEQMLLGETIRGDINISKNYSMPPTRLKMQ